jgi:hypothetical protein
MTHPAPEQLGAYLDGELDAVARAGIDAHLRDCADCAAHLADLASIDGAARQVPLAVPEGYFEGFAPRVRARLEQRPRARWRPPVWGWAAAAALVLGVVTPLVYRESASRHAAPQAATQPEPAASPRLESAERPALQAPASRRQAGADQDAAGEGREPQSTLAAPPPRPAGAPPEPKAGANAKPEGFAFQDHAERANAPQEERLGRRDRAEPPPLAGAGAPPAAPPPLAATRAAEAKREQDAPVPPVPADQGLAKDERAKLKQDEHEQLRALGYTAPPPPPPPPATGQRQHGPRSQNTVPPPPARKAAAQPSAAAASADKEQAVDAGQSKSEPGAGALQESVTVVQESSDRLAGAESVKFRSLQRSRPRTDGEARALREEWRKFAEAHPNHPQADEARVRLVEAGALAYRLGRRAQDLETAVRDGRDYLERAPARQAARVRAALKTLER